MMKVHTLLLLVLIAFVQTVFAQDYCNNVYLDTDYNSNTGCTVNQSAFSTQFNSIDAHRSIVTTDSPVSIIGIGTYRGSELLILTVSGLESHIISTNSGFAAYTAVAFIEGVSGDFTYT